MIQFLVRRFISLIVLLFFVSVLVFVLLWLAPGDFLAEASIRPDIPESFVTEMRERYGLDQAWYVQYWIWLKNVAQLDFGHSMSYNIPVLDLIAQRLPATFVLSLTSILFVWLVAIPIGVLSAIYKDSWIDKLSRFLASITMSIPEFLLAVLLLYLVARTGILPIGGLTSVDHEFMSPLRKIADYIHHLILPTIVMGVVGISGMMRVMRANFLDHMREDYVRTARAKGLPEGVIMFKHVLRNAINPLITSFGFAFSSLLSGSLLVEKVLNFPGLGLLIFDSFMKEDQYVVMASILMSCSMLVLGNLLADILLAWSDPRIRMNAK
jgi:peptide/nickel transport system permease protein